MRKFKFEHLEDWKLALDLTDLLNGISYQFPTDERFNLGSQLRRATTSVSLNIAEGSTGQSDPEQTRFLGMALRSVLECVACLGLIERRQFVIEPMLLEEANDLCHFLACKLQAFRNSLVRSA